jgi:hypothetical protein
MKRSLFVFVFSFVTNLFWENLHASLYLGYKGGFITEWILVRATFWDAVIISGLLFGARFLPRHGRVWFIFIGGLAIAIFMERWALATKRWSYTSAMPIIPFIHTGLTPTFQITLLGLVTYFAAEQIFVS